MCKIGDINYAIPNLSSSVFTFEVTENKNIEFSE
jgi:hypothetical protein